VTGASRRGPLRLPVMRAPRDEPGGGFRSRAWGVSPSGLRALHPAL